MHQRNWLHKKSSQVCQKSVDSNADLWDIKQHSLFFSFIQQIVVGNVLVLPLGVGNTAETNLDNVLAFTEFILQRV